MTAGDVESRLAALETRVAELEDEKAIRELLSRYGYYADACLDDEYFDLFTDDCVMDVSSGQADDPYSVVRWEGVEALREFLSVRTARHGDGFYGRSLHMQGNNLAVRIDGPEAVASNYSFILQQAEPDIRLVSASINEWVLRKVDGRWFVQSRIRRRVGAPDTADVVRATEG
ncbi:nuclear transport factor 2 family protein [Gordonia terrae]|uniref:nuclear transport factor 2 family protein n=1 Tax=Gordonia terrae TaxID=2055 RepID=UPI003F6BDF6D